MGNSTQGLAHDPSTLPETGYNPEQITLLDGIFQDLAKRTGEDNTIAKSTFIEFFNLPGILGDRLFRVFDSKGDGVIHFEEFVTGLSRYNHGSTADKVQMLFQVYALDEQEFITRDELSMVLFSLVTPTSALFSEQPTPLSQGPSGKITHASRKAREVVAQLVHEAFTEFDKNDRGSLSHEEFSQWIEKNPAVGAAITDSFAQHSWSDMTLTGTESLRASSVGLSPASSPQPASDSAPANAVEETSPVDSLRIDMIEVWLTSPRRDQNRHQGMLTKLGARMKNRIERWMVLENKCLYSFRRQEDELPSSCVFVSGWFIEKIESDEITTKHNLFGFQMLPPLDSIAEPKTFYSENENDLETWIERLRGAAQTLAIETQYRIGRVIGKGHFSVVHVGTHIETQAEVAIKIVDKKRITDRHKEAFRTEIAVMKLVRHPRVIRLQEVFEDKGYMYLVMPLIRHGDFWARWRKVKTYDEERAKAIIYRLLDAVDYLHALGIVHRDIKAENLLCLSETDDTELIVSDFGLSKFTSPNESIVAQCGTLGYVAPEVLDSESQGYNKQVDLWSIGCLMFLVLSGKLPFKAESDEEVIRKIIHDDFELTGEKWESTSAEAKELVSLFLVKNPTERVTVEGAMSHPWFDSMKERTREDEKL